MSRCKNTAQPAFSEDGVAWYYENEGSIEIFIQIEGFGMARCKIHRSKLADWIRHTERVKP